MKKIVVFLLFALSFQCFANGLNLNPEIQQQLIKMYRSHQGEVPHERRRAYPNLIVFVTLSMPTSSLQGIIRQASKLNAAVVIRGIVPQGFKATVRRITHILVGNRTNPQNILGGVSIDPERFKQFHVDVAPTYVLLESGKCINSKKYCDSQYYDKLVGNITPISALNLFRNVGDHGKLAEKVLKGMK